MKQFTSKDFSRTRSQLTADLPKKLIHRNVRESRDVGFSEERKHPVAVVDLPSKSISMTIGGLEPAQSTNRHRHTYETILYILEGEGTTFIEDEPVEWKAGDAVYIPVWAWHYHWNASVTKPCVYIACENAPLLQNLGGIALREETR
jgi:quercetin dioxygenase-like cupin family protein